MSIRRVVPNIQSARFDESREFYTELLGFDIAMDMGWVMTFASPTHPTAQVTLLRESDSATPHPSMSIEVADVDTVHAKAIARGLQIVYPLTDEEWRVRRFLVSDPNGVVINILSHSQ